MEKEFAGSTAAGSYGRQTDPIDPASPSEDRHILERDQWLSTMADYEVNTDRRFKALNRRVDRLESRARLISMPEEMKTFLVMTGVSVAAAVLVPIIQELVSRWKRRES